MAAHILYIVCVCLPIFCTLQVYACPNSVHCTCMPAQTLYIVRVCLPKLCTLHVYACPYSVHCTCMPAQTLYIVRVCLPKLCTLYVYDCPNSVHCMCMTVSCSCHCNALVFLPPGRPCTAVPWRTLPTLSGYWRNFTTSLYFTTIPRNTSLRSVMWSCRSPCVLYCPCVPQGQSTGKTGSPT